MVAAGGLWTGGDAKDMLMAVKEDCSQTVALC